MKFLSARMRFVTLCMCAVVVAALASFHLATGTVKAWDYTSNTSVFLDQNSHGDNLFESYLAWDKGAIGGGPFSSMVQAIDQPECGSPCSVWPVYDLSTTYTATVYGIVVSISSAPGGSASGSTATFYNDVGANRYATIYVNGLACSGIPWNWVLDNEARYVPFHNGAVYYQDDNQTDWW